MLAISNLLDCFAMFLQDINPTVKNSNKTFTLFNVFGFEMVLLYQCG